jgi:hypothetical protein
MVSGRLGAVVATGTPPYFPSLKSGCAGELYVEAVELDTSVN